MEMLLIKNQQEVMDLIKKFCKENPTYEYETEIQSCQAHYPINRMIERWLESQGYAQYKVYGKEINNKISKTVMEIVDINNDYKYTGVDLIYKKKKIKTETIKENPVKKDNGITVQYIREKVTYKAKIDWQYEAIRLS